MLHQVRKRERLLLKATGHVIGRSGGPWRGQTRASSECRSQSARNKQERDFFVPGIILAWVWDRPGAFSGRPINFLNFCMLWVRPSPNQSLLSPSKADGPLWSEPLPAPILISTTLVPAFPWSHPNLVQEGSSRAFPLISCHLTGLASTQWNSLLLPSCLRAGEHVLGSTQRCCETQCPCHGPGRLRRYCLCAMPSVP